MARRIAIALLVGLLLVMAPGSLSKKAKRGKKGSKKGGKKSSGAGVPKKSKSSTAAAADGAATAAEGESYGHGDTIFSMPHSSLSEKEELILGTHGAQDLFVSKKCKTCRKVVEFLKSELDDSALRGRKEVDNFMSTVCVDMAEWHGPEMVTFCETFIAAPQYIDNMAKMLVANPRVGGWVGVVVVLC